MDREDTLNTKQDSFLQHLALENLIHNSRSALNGDETAVAISSASDSAPSSDSSTTTSCSGLDLAEWWLNNRSCQICGNEFKSNSFKSRERQDHLAKEHYRARVETRERPKSFFSPADTDLPLPPLRIQREEAAGRLQSLHPETQGGREVLGRRHGGGKS